MKVTLQSKTASGRVKLSGSRLLIVDGNGDFTLLVQHFFQRFNVAVDCAEDATSALELVQASVYHFTITELVLPVIDGCEYIRQVRRGGYTQPILVVSSYVVPNHIERALASGANAFFAKPVDLAAVAEAMAGYL